MLTLERGPLLRTVAQFDTALPLAQAKTPPASWYRDGAMLDLEKQVVFGATWQFAARQDQLQEEGAYVAGHVGDEPFVVVRTGGQLRAFYNVCRHHAAGLVSGEGRVRRFVCPYHGWTYDLEGHLVATTRTQGICDFTKEDHGLVPMAVETVGPFVFVHGGAGRPRPLAEAFPGLVECFEGPSAAGNSRSWAGLRHHGRRTYDMDCNWKVYVDNYLDGGYHVPVLHRGLTGQLDMASYETTLFDGWNLQACGGKAGESRTAGGAAYVWLYPNFMINRYGPVMDTNLVIPLGPTRTRTVFDFYFEEGTDPAFVKQSLASSEIVQAEDVAISESVQRGLGSRAYVTGRYAPAVEKAEHHFHRLLAADLTAALS